jgi:hypothetical protein
MLEDLYGKRAGELWGEFGFVDAFNDSRDWIAEDFWIGIDVGPIAPMIENYRSGLCWRLFMGAPEIRRTVDRLGIRRTTGAGDATGPHGLSPSAAGVGRAPPSRAEGAATPLE